MKRVKYSLINFSFRIEIEILHWFDNKINVNRGFNSTIEFRRKINTRYL